MAPTCYKMVRNKLDNGAQYSMKWCPISWKMLLNVA